MERRLALLFSLVGTRNRHRHFSIHAPLAAAFCFAATSVPLLRSQQCPADWLALLLSAAAWMPLLVARALTSWAAVGGGLAVLPSAGAGAGVEGSGAGDIAR